MRSETNLAISVLALSLGNVIACSVDDSVGIHDSGRTTATTATTGSVTTGRTTAVTTGSGGRGTGGVPVTAGTGGATTAAVTTTTSTGGGGASGGTGGTGGGDTDAGPEDGTGGMPDDGGADAADAAEVEACAAESDSAFCLRNRKNCGAFSAADNCGLARNISCGICLGTTCGGSGTLNVCSGGAPINRAQGGTVEASHPSNPPAFAAEDMFKVFDNSVLTKWFVPAHTGVTWIDYQFPGTATYAITSYTVTSANDVPSRDPRAWQLQGSLDGVTWITVDSRTDQSFELRFQTNTYTFTNAKAYPVYRFNVTDPDASDFQVAEIQLFGDPGPASEAGTDAAADVSVDHSGD